MKKTLVFCRGRAPRGEKTNWVMHEYCVHSKSAYRSAKEEWVVCRVFQKSVGVKKHPTTQTTRAINLEIMGPSDILSSPMIPLDLAQFNLGRNYIINNHVDQLAELSRVLQTGPTSATLPIQTHVNHPLAGGSGPGGGRDGITISGPPPPLRPIINQEGAQHTSSMLSGLGNNNGYGPIDNMNINGHHGGSNSGFMNVENCMEFYNYWPT